MYPKVMNSGSILINVVSTCCTPLDRATLIDPALGQTLIWVLKPMTMKNGECWSSKFWLIRCKASKGSKSSKLVKNVTKNVFQRKSDDRHNSIVFLILNVLWADFVTNGAVELRKGLSLALSFGLQLLEEVQTWRDWLQDWLLDEGCKETCCYEPN